MFAGTLLQLKRPSPWAFDAGFEFVVWSEGDQALKASHELVTDNFTCEFESRCRWHLVAALETCGKVATVSVNVCNEVITTSLLD